MTRANYGVTPDVFRYAYWDDHPDGTTSSEVEFTLGEYSPGVIHITYRDLLGLLENAPKDEGLDQILAARTQDFQGVLDKLGYNFQTTL